MSTMLKTTNPEAVEEMEPDRDRRVPYAGQILIYHARPGEGRQGKPQVAALALNVEDEDHVELLIMWAADDFIVRWKIPRQTDQNPINSWSFNAYDDEHYMRVKEVEPPKSDVTTLDQLYAEIGTLRNRVAELEKPRKGVHKTT